ncbi:MAG: PAS domain S-box protein [Planctomycetota bacterium]
MGDFLRLLFDTQDFPPRWQCGNWSSALGWLHILSDLGIWLAYMGIPIGLAIVLRRRKADIPFPRLFWLFCAFIASCGIGHLIEAGIFWWPAYRLSGLVKLITAVVSLVTMAVAIGLVSKALRMPSLRGMLSELQSERSVSRSQIQSLTAERERLQFAIDAAGAGLWDWAIDVDRLTWNRNTRELFGLAENAPARGFESFVAAVHDDDRARVVAAVDRARAGDSGLNLTFRIRRPDGSERYVMTRSSVLRDEGGAATRMTGVILDVTDQEIGQQLFQNAVESAPCGMMLVDQEGRVLLANSHAGALFGWQPAELIGRPIEDLVPAARRATHVDLRREYFRDPTRRTMAAGRDLTGLRRDGTEVPVEILLSPVHLAQGPAVISTIVDVSPRKQAEAERQRYAEELERRNRALDEFAYLVSHDLKAPLRAISMVSGWLQADFGDKLGAEGNEHLQTLQERSAKMNTLIQGALTYARAGREQGQIGPVDCGDVLREVVRMIDVPPGCEVAATTPLPVIRIDRDHLLKILLNLIGNAVQHTERADARVEIGAEERADEFAITVRDNGPGIDKQHHQRVFRMFERLPGARGDSTGVGLAIVRMLVERHGGTVTIDSELGRGAAFTFTVPKAPTGAVTQAMNS